MTTQQQRQQIDISQAQVKTHKWLSKRVVLVGIVIIVAVVVATIWILSNLEIIPGSWATIFTTIVTVLGAVFAFLQVIHSATHESTQSAPIIVQLPPTQLPPPLLFLEKPAHRGIVGFPPLADSRTIQQREHVVREVYAKLMQDDITAIALTGIGGAGKSTLAALIYRYTEDRLHNHSSPFLAETIWLTVDPVVTFADLVGNLFEALGKSLSDLSNLAPQNQAVALFNALNSTDKPRLIILDQFENLLDWDTGYALADRPGVGEWLDIINNRLCACRVLLTSRPRPIGTREYPSTYLQEYAVGGLEMNEGITLLQSQGVQGTEIELQRAVLRCAGHAFSLTLLATLMRDHHMNLATLFKDATLWSGDIATQILNQIYAQILNDIQRELLKAFSIYREPAPIEAVQAVVPNVSRGQLSSALRALRVQHLLEPVGEGRYQLHAIILEDAQQRFDESSEQANEEALRAAHARAAKYYLQRAETTCPPREERKKLSDIHDLIEVVWQYCQAGKWQEAYDLMRNEEIFGDLNRWGSNAILLELCQLLQTEKWYSKLSETALIYKNLGSAYNDLGQMNQAQMYFEKALRLWSKSGDRNGECATLNSLGSVFRDLGQKEQGQIYLEQALDIARKLGIRKEESVALINLAVIYADFGQKEQARVYCEQASEICREIGDLWGEGWARNVLGLIYNDLEQKEQARDYLMQALKIRTNLGNRLGEGRTTNHLGRVYIMLGLYQQGMEYCREALNIAKAIGDSQGEGKAYSNLGWAFFVLGEGEQARKYSEQALVILKEIGDRGMEARALYNLSLACSLLEQQDEALHFYREALSIFREIKDYWREGETLFEIGKIYFEREHYDVTLACFLLVKNVFTELQNPLLKETQIWIEKIKGKFGDEQFAALLATVEPRAQEFVDPVLNAGIE